MTTMHAAVLIVHVLIAVMIIVLVLIQRGKGAEQGAAFGAGASGTVFGARGSANFLSRTTAALATLFFVTSLSLAFLGSQRPASESLIDLIPTGDTPAVILPAEPAQDDDLPSIRDFGAPETRPEGGTREAD